MNWQALLHPDIQSFIIEHANADVRALALKKPPSAEWPYPLILDQIKARQKGSVKFPEFTACSGVILPRADIIEQASSQACAAYKASLVEGSSFADLTGGSGMDAFALAQTHTGPSYVIERDQTSAEILAHNLAQLNLAHVSAVHGDSVEFVRAIPPVDTVMIDPQRREGQKRGIFALEECSPNILKLLPHLAGKVKTILLKTSPVLDITKAVEQIGCVSAVHIIQHKKECKELVFIITPDHKKETHSVPITAVTVDEAGKPFDNFTFTIEQENNAESLFSPPLRYLYEPSPAYQKSGAFKLLGGRFDLKKLHPNTHLYTSEEPVSGFPGRVFEILHCCPVNKKALKEILPEMKAGVSVRNFNMGADELRKKLGLSESNFYTVFACEILPQEKSLIVCIKCATD